MDLNIRPPVSVSLGVHVEGAALPHPDPQDPLTTIAGVRKRFAIRPPAHDPVILAEFREFVRNWVRRKFRPISSDADTSVDAWLARTNYPLWRKEELKRKWEEVIDIRSQHRDGKRAKYFECKSFMKDESYPSYKHARSINSRSDEFKCAVGPTFKLMEDIVYQHPAFIKHIPVHQRPDYILNRLYAEGYKYGATDHTAFEAAFVAELMEAGEFELYDYLTSVLPSHDEFMSLIRDVLAGDNVCRFKHFSVELEATRMSGEMCTSLGNGFANLMFIKFCSWKFGCGKVKCVVEGDDALARAKSFPTAEQYAKLGLMVKIEVHESLTTASFCGLIFDLEERINVADPIKNLVAFGWVSRKYAKSRDCVLLRLLRCKALSLAHAHPGCPVLYEFALYVLRCTRTFDMATFVRNSSYYNANEWYRDRTLAAIAEGVPVREVGWRTRLLVEAKYGLSPELQRQWEDIFRSCNTIKPIELPNFHLFVHGDWHHYWSNYVQRQDKKLVTDRPCGSWSPMEGWHQEW